MRWPVRAVQRGSWPWQMFFATASIPAIDAIAALESVGRNALTARLSEPVFAQDAARHQPDHPGITWAGPHLTPSPNLWTELASLRDEAGARASGAWIGASLEAAQLHALKHAQTRVDAVAASFDCAAELLEASAPQNG